MTKFTTGTVLEQLFFFYYTLLTCYYSDSTGLFNFGSLCYSNYGVSVPFSSLSSFNVSHRLFILLFVSLYVEYRGLALAILGVSTICRSEFSGLPSMSVFFAIILFLLRSRFYF